MHLLGRAPAAAPPSPGLGSSRLSGVHRPAPAVALHRHAPRLLPVHAPGVGLGRIQAAERQRRHGPVRPDAPDRPPRRAGLPVLMQLDLVVRWGLRDAPHGALTSANTRSPSSVTSMTRSGPGVRAT